MTTAREIGKVYLIGLMGAGKSTVGKILAEALNWHLIDVDHEIEKFAGSNIPTIFEEEGEGGFRDYESQVLLETVEKHNAIIPCGGGIITRPENVAFLRDQLTVWLDVSPEEAASRLEKTNERPLLNECRDTVQKLREILNDRQAAYAQAASIHILTGKQAPDTIAAEILEKMETYDA